MFHVHKHKEMKTLTRNMIKLTLITLKQTQLFLKSTLLSLFNRRPALLLDFSCHLPPPHRKCSLDHSEHFVHRTGRFSPQSLHFMRSIFLKSGLGSDTYAPPFVFDTDDAGATLASAMQEACEGMFGCIDALLAKTGVHPALIDHLVVTCGGFSPSPSLASLVVNRYKLRQDVKAYNLSGMGCGSGVIAIDLATKLLDSDSGYWIRKKKVRYGLVVITENISLNWYSGDNRSMLVTNCIFRVGCAAAMVTNDPSRRREAKFELLHSLRTHHAADDRAYRAAFQEEDENGITGLSLTKDLVHVAGHSLQTHIRALAPRVLPLSELASYAMSVLVSKLVPGGGFKTAVPDFTTAFEHMCIHTGGRAVIEAVAKVLRLDEWVTEPARMTLHRFGNTSSSMVLYELAYFEAKSRVRRGDRVWVLGFGTGFKVGSLVWRALRDLEPNEEDNPWTHCVHSYPLKSW